MSGSLASFLKLKMDRGYSTPRIYGQLKHYLRYTRFTVFIIGMERYSCVLHPCAIILVSSTTLQILFVLFV